MLNKVFINQPTYFTGQTKASYLFSFFFLKFYRNQLHLKPNLSKKVNLMSFNSKYNYFLLRKNYLAKSEKYSYREAKSIIRVITGSPFGGIVVLQSAKIYKMLRVFNNLLLNSFLLNFNVVVFGSGGFRNEINALNSLNKEFPLMKPVFYEPFKYSTKLKKYFRVISRGRPSLFVVTALHGGMVDYLSLHSFFTVSFSDFRLVDKRNSGLTIPLSLDNYANASLLFTYAFRLKQVALGLALWTFFSMYSRYSLYLKHTLI